ncbi:MAG: tRNA (N6-threonylcarbamoyladenosine(37)-N6)-methyltransferase TrmO [Thermomicrobiales bacterium]
MKRWFRVQAIGVIRRPGAGEPAVDDFFDPALESVIEIDPRWSDGLTRIEEYSHLVVLFYLDRATRRRAAGRSATPEGRQELPPVGFFATRTPKRPNPVGIGCPRLTRREGNRLVVTGLDAWDGTPVIDVKGYSRRDEYHPEAVMPGWLLHLWEQHDADRGR